MILSRKPVKLKLRVITVTNKVPNYEFFYYQGYWIIV